MLNPQSIRARAYELLDHGYSAASIAERIGASRRTVRFYLNQWRREYAAQSKDLPPCRCGAANNHHHACDEKPYRRQPLRQAPPDFAKVHATMSRRDLMRKYKAQWWTIQRWLSADPNLMPVRPPKRRLRECGRVTSRINDSLFNRVERLVPMGFAPDLRADIISDLYLAAYSGEVPNDQLEVEGRAIMDRTIRFCSGPLEAGTILSLDLEDEDGHPLSSRIADPASMVPFEYRGVEP